MASVIQRRGSSVLGSASVVVLALSSVWMIAGAADDHGNGTPSAAGSGSSTPPSRSSRRTGSPAPGSSAIARRAGLNKQLISHHFGGKPALYDAVMPASAGCRAAARWIAAAAAAAGDPRRCSSTGPAATRSGCGCSCGRRSTSPTRAMACSAVRPSGASATPSGSAGSSDEQAAGRLPADLDADLLLLLSLLGAAVYPLLLPEVCELMTGSRPDDERSPSGTGPTWRPWRATSRPATTVDPRPPLPGSARFGVGGFIRRIEDPLALVLDELAEPPRGRVPPPACGVDVGQDAAREAERRAARRTRPPDAPCGVAVSTVTVPWHRGGSSVICMEDPSLPPVGDGVGNRASR